MKKLYTLLLLLVVAILPAQAAIYMIGNTPFGNWDIASGVAMQDDGTGVFTHTTYINGSVWFVFADSLNTNWDEFNANHRYGPSGNSSQEVQTGTNYSTSKQNNNHAYKFTGSGKEYTFTFNLNYRTFRIDEYQEPAEPDPIIPTRGDVNADGEISIGDVNTLVDIIMGASYNYDWMKRADVDGDSEVGISDVNAVINIILGGDPPEIVKTGYDYVWDEEAIPEIHLEVSLSEWNRLLSLYDANARTTQYVMASCTFTKDGETTVLDSVGLRLKGNTSRRRPEGNRGEMHQKDNTDWNHVHFGVHMRKYVDEDYHTIQGIQKLHLKWFKDDPSYVRELFCYELFRRAGIWTAPRDIYCRLWVHVQGDSQETYYGIYEMIEPIDKRYLKDRKTQFGTSTGYLWKCRYPAGLNNTNADFWYDDDTDDRHTYTLQTQTDELDSAKVQLKDFITKLTSLNDTEFYTWIQEVTDVNLLLKTYAVNVAVGMWDDYWNDANNYYIYFNGKHLTGYKFFFIPYDYDNTMGTTSNCGVQNDAVTHSPLNWGNNDNPLIARLLRFDNFKAIYINHLKFLVANGNAMMDRSSSQARIKLWQQMIEPYIDNVTGEDTEIRDEPASWSSHGEYRLLENGGNNFFTAKAASINSLQ